MSETTVPVAEIKARLSEYVSLSSSQGTRVVITKRGKPVAALVSISDLRTLSHAEERKGLVDVAGKWQDFGEVAEIIEKAFKDRRANGHRHVPF